MKKSPYSEYSKEQLILRDILSLDRTILSNERNLLAYIRTSLALLVAGVTLIHFFENIFFHILGWFLLFSGIITMYIGVKRYRGVKRTIEDVKQTAGVENRH